MAALPWPRRWVLPTKPAGVVLITGGNGSLGLILGRWICKQAEKSAYSHPLKLIFLSRSAVVSTHNEPMWLEVKVCATCSIYMHMHMQHMHAHAHATYTCTCTCTCTCACTHARAQLATCTCNIYMHMHMFNSSPFPLPLERHVLRSRRAGSVRVCMRTCMCGRACVGVHVCPCTCMRNCINATCRRRRSGMAFRSSRPSAICLRSARLRHSLTGSV